MSKPPAPGYSAWLSSLSPSEAALLRAVELCGFTLVIEREEIDSVHKSSSGPAPVEVHLRALGCSQGWG